MKTKTILEAMVRARNHMEIITHTRGTNFGIAVNNDPLAKHWQHLERQYQLFLARLTTRIEKDGSK